MQLRTLREYKRKEMFSLNYNFSRFMQVIGKVTNLIEVKIYFDNLIFNQNIFCKK